MSVLTRPPNKDQMTFDQRLFWLNEDINCCKWGTVHAPGSTFAFGGTFRPFEERALQFQATIQEANECLALAKNGNGNHPNEPCEVSSQQIAERQQKGFPVEPLPQKDISAATNCVKLALTACGEFFEENNQHLRALGMYHKCIKLSQELDKVGSVWCSNTEMITMMSNLGLCYKRLRLYNRAQDWYNRCFVLVVPGSEDEKDLQNNQHWLNVARQDDARNRLPPPTIQVCWTCGISPSHDPNIHLLKCSRCTAEQKEDFALYCGKSCQKKDWKHHRSTCHNNNN